MTAATGRSALAAAARAVGLAAVSAVSAGLVFTLAASGIHRLSGNRMAPWILGRAAGVCAYVLLVVLVISGQFLSHPARANWRRPSTATRIRAHIVIAAFALTFLVVHVLVLATDRYAHVGWWGALVPMGAAYRPVPTTLGVIAAWAGLVAGLTAHFAGRLPRRVWWPIHKVAAAVFALAWVHGVTGGGDSAALRTMYLATGAAVIVGAIARYTARTPADRVAELQR